MKKTETINVLRKEDFEKGFEDVVMAFVGEENINYLKQKNKKR